MKIVVIDGQGGKIGSLIISEVKKITGTSDSLIAIGTNSAATAAMLKAGADGAATGDNPVIVNCRDADIIAGTVGIISADALLGEITPEMAKAIGQSSALKILIPFNKCGIYIAGCEEASISACIESAVEKIKTLMNKE